MSMIPAQAILDDFHRMLRERWRYRWGAASDGEVDCSGAFVWSWRQHGKSIYHGSNRIARRYTGRLIPTAQARSMGLIVPGMAVFKAHEPGGAGYALPSAYRPGGELYNGDLNDYYHIGLVDEDTAFVLNAQSAKTGFVRSRLTENWSHVAFLTDVAYDWKEDHMQAKVTGGRLRLRAAPAATAPVLLSIPDGAAVTVLGDAENGWRQVRAEGRTGYVMAQYLTKEGSGTSAPEEAADAESTVTLKVPVNAARALLDELIARLGVG